MILFPAIDLKDGQCVRLLRGDMAKATVFNDSPAAQAKAFAEAGFDWLHVVDLNGAVAGQPVNGAAVDEHPEGGRRCRSSSAAASAPSTSIERWLEAGVSRVILGTVAVKEPGPGARPPASSGPGQIAVGIDARDGKVAVEGWTKQQRPCDALDLAQRFEDAGVAAIIYTDIDRDGAMSGVNVDATGDARPASSTMPVIASGGVASLDDIARAAGPPRSTASPARSSAARSTTAGVDRARRHPRR